MNKAWRRQSSADWEARAVKVLCAENKVWNTGCCQLRAQSDAEFREAVEEAAALHSRDDLFPRHTEPEPAPERPCELSHGGGVRRRGRRAHARRAA